MNVSKRKERKVCSQRAQSFHRLSKLCTGLCGNRFLNNLSFGSEVLRYRPLRIGLTVYRYPKFRLT
jgi:hypothetical protein